MKVRRRTLWTIGVAVAAAVLVALLALIALGVLVLPGTPGPAPVSVTSVQFTVLQGTNASGNGWLGPSSFSYSGVVNGYPFDVAPGGTFTVSVTWTNYDSNPHTIYSVSVAAPFAFSRTTPALPATLSANQDDALMQIYVVAPNGSSAAGASLTLFVTVNALPPS